MKVLVTNLNGVKKREDGSYQHFVKSGSRWPMTVGFSKSVDYYPFPFSLSYTSAILKRDTEVEVKGFDGVVKDLTNDEYIEAVLKEKPDIIVTELTTLTIEDDLSLLKAIYNALGCRIAVGGSYVTVYPEKVLVENPFIEIALIGEYEFTVKEVIDHMMGKRMGLNGIAGIAFRGGDGQINKTKPRLMMMNLDQLPFPDRDDFPATIYPDFTLYSPCINIISSRGCPAGCVYCVERHITYNSPKYRMFSAKRVVDEMEHCIQKYGAKQFYFDDMSFVVSRRHVSEICDEIRRRNIKVPWTCMGDAMFVDYETLKKMAETGCIGMKFGVESADPIILKKIGKPLNLEKAKQIVMWCKDIGIRTHATFCLGLPGETVESIKKTMTYMGELGVDTAQVSKVVPYPGTPMYRWAIERGYLTTDDFSKFDGTGKAIVSYPNLSAEEIDRWYKIFCKKVMRQKLIKYFIEPSQSFSIIREVFRQKGLLSTVQSIKTFVRRAI